ncbi:MAG: sulfatase-like hydrolase/transferase [Planctomycetota bacterium]|jgi:arylsulfatase A-like enzyme
MLTRRDFLRIAGTGILVSGFGCAAKAARKARKRPNIIYLMSDDQRWDTLGCYGNPEFKTHNLDKLAEQGVLFENCYYAVSICMPSRATVLTGQFMSRHRCGFDRPTDYTISRSEFALTYPMALRKAGYRTGFIGKLGFAVTEEKVRPCRELWKNPDYMPAGQFDYWRGWPGQAPRGEYWPKDFGPKESHEKTRHPHLTDVMGDLILDFVRTNPADKPFCLSVSFHAPKGALVPSDAKPEYDKQFDGVRFKLPGNYVAGENDDLPDLIKRNWRGLDYHRRYTWTPELYQKFVRRQAALGYGIDVVVGRLVKELKDRGLLENSVIIYTSDNGFFNGSHGLDGKALLYEESMRAPLIVFDGRLPRRMRGRRLRELISTVDFAPTIMDLADLSTRDSMQGVSFKPLIEGRDVRWRDAVFLENNFTQFKALPLAQAKDDPQALAKTKRDSLRCHGIRAERWKYIRFFEVEPVFEELFDLKGDPLEQHNLAAEAKYANVLDELRARCDRLYKLASSRT